MNGWIRFVLLLLTAQRTLLIYPLLYSLSLVFLFPPPLFSRLLSAQALDHRAGKGGKEKVSPSLFTS